MRYKFSTHRRKTSKFVTDILNVSTNGYINIREAKSLPSVAGVIVCELCGDFVYTESFSEMRIYDIQIRWDKLCVPVCISCSNIVQGKIKKRLSIHHTTEEDRRAKEFRKAVRNLKKKLKGDYG